MYVFLDWSDSPSFNASEQLAGIAVITRMLLMLRKEKFEKFVILVDTTTRSLEQEKLVLFEELSERRLLTELESNLHWVSRAEAMQMLSKIEANSTVFWPIDVMTSPEVVRKFRDTQTQDILAARTDAQEDSMGPVRFSKQVATAYLSQTRCMREFLRSESFLTEWMDISSEWLTRLSFESGKKYATKKLFDACRKSVDGLVSRHINRHISIAISKRIVHTKVTPNQMSGITFLLGVLAAFLVAQGGYWYVVLGTFFFQWNSILDGVDGELARVRYQHSKLGQWVDTVSDDTSNVMFWAALGIGARQIPAIGELLFWCGIVTAISNGLLALVYYIELIALGSGDFYDIGWNFDKSPKKSFMGMLTTFFKYVLKKDFFILFCFALSVFYVLHYSLPVMAAAGVGTFLAALIRAIKVAAKKKSLRA